MKHSSKRGMVSRGIQYCYGPLEKDFDEATMNKILNKAVKAGTIQQFDTGRGRMIWFEGMPGPELRALRKQVEDLIDETGA